MMGAFAALDDISGTRELDDDRVLVEAAQKEPCAFDAIYTRYAQRVFLYLRSRVSHEDDALDLTQQVFVKAMRALPGYKEAGTPLAAWLFRIARNAAIDHHRRRRDSTTLDAVPTALREQGHGPEDAAIIHEEYTVLHAALMRLDRDKRELLALRYAGGLRIKEIAAVTGKTEEATKKRISRALQSLREYYDVEI